MKAEYLYRTRRCGVRLFQEKDMAPFMAYRNDLEWMGYQNFKGLTEEEYRRALLGEPNCGRGVQLAVTDKGDSLLGDLYVREDAEEIEIGYAVSPAFSGRGYAREAVWGLLVYLRGRTDKPIVAEVHPENRASIALLKELSFREEESRGGWIRFIHSEEAFMEKY